MLDSSTLTGPRACLCVCGWLCSALTLGARAICPGLLACDRRRFARNCCPLKAVYRYVVYAPTCRVLRLSGLSPSHVRHDMACNNSPALEEQTRNSVSYSSLPKSLPSSSSVPSLLNLHLTPGCSLLCSQTSVPVLHFHRYDTGWDPSSTVDQRMAASRPYRVQPSRHHPVISLAGRKHICRTRFVRISISSAPSPSIARTSRAWTHHTCC